MCDQRYFISQIYELIHYSNYNNTCGMESPMEVRYAEVH